MEDHPDSGGLSNLCHRAGHAAASRIAQDVDVWGQPPEVRGPGD